MTHKLPADIRSALNIIEWTPEGLRAIRKKLNLRISDIAYLMDVSVPTIVKIERGEGTSPSHLVHYGLILERYYAYLKDLVPAYRYIGSNAGYSQEFIEESLKS